MRPLRLVATLTIVVSIHLLSCDGSNPTKPGNGEDDDPPVVGPVPGQLSASPPQVGALSEGPVPDLDTQPAESDLPLPGPVVSPGGLPSPDRDGSGHAPPLGPRLGPGSEAGGADIIWRDMTTGLNVVWEMEGTGFVSIRLLGYQPDLDWSIEGAEDFTGDGHTDLLWRNRATGENAVWEMEGPYYIGTHGLGRVDDTDWTIGATGYLTGADHPDILWRNSVTGENAIWEMNGLSWVTTHGLGTVADLTWQVEDVGDMTGDGDADVVWRSASTGENYIWRMDGPVFVALTALETASDVAFDLAGVGEMTGDEHTDIVWRNLGSGSNAVWPMTGTTYTATEWLPSVPDTDWRIVAVGDMAWPEVPDLTITTPLSLSIVWVPAGGELPMPGWTLANQGTGPSGEFNNGYYLSTDAEITSDDLYLDGNSMPTMGPGSTFDWPAGTIPIPEETAPGDYFIGILADHEGAVEELDESNNYVSAAFTVLEPLRPDLTITTPLSLPIVWVPAGGELPIPGWTVANQGTGPSGEFDNGFYLSTDAEIGPGDVYLGGNTNPGLAAGESYEWRVATVTIPAGTTPGEYYFGILVDAGDAVAEIDEGNNHRSQGILVLEAALPDLLPTTMPAVSPTTVAPGGSVSLGGLPILNQGGAESGSFHYGYYLSEDSEITDDDTYLAGSNRGSVDPGETVYQGGRSVVIPGRTPEGDYYLGVLIDDEDDVSESDEGNNYLSRSITVEVPTGPDLVITTSLSVDPGTVAPGGQVTLSAWTVMNQGTEFADGFDNGYYLSADPVITTGDTFLSWIPNSTGLPAGDSWTWNGPTLTIPVGTAHGTWYIGVLVDYGGAVTETDEGNNYESVAVVVGTGGEN